MILSFDLARPSSIVTTSITTSATTKPQSAAHLMRAAHDLHRGRDIDVALHSRYVD
jgi:hypothetical protein